MFHKKYQCEELIKICGIQDKTVERVQSAIEEVIDNYNDGRDKTIYRLNSILLTLDGLGCDIDIMKEKIRGMI